MSNTKTHTVTHTETTEGTTSGFCRRDKREPDADDYTCPFCEETDFDLAGLKYHLLHFCYKYKQIDTKTSLFD
jgi:hypothetical protein